MSKICVLKVFWTQNYQLFLLTSLPIFKIRILYRMSQHWNDFDG